MPAKVIAGKWIKLKINGEFVQCQLDLSLNITNNTSTEDPCKPEDPSLGASNNFYTIDSRDWTVDFNGKQMSAELAMNGVNQADLVRLVLTGDSQMDVIIGGEPASTTNYPYDTFQEYSGTVLLTELALTWPATGSSTYDASFQGNSDLVFVETPVSTTP